MRANLQGRPIGSASHHEFRASGLPCRNQHRPGILTIDAAPRHRLLEPDLVFSRLQSGESQLGIRTHRPRRLAIQQHAVTVDIGGRSVGERSHDQISPTARLAGSPGTGGTELDADRPHGGAVPGSEAEGRDVASG